MQPELNSHEDTGHESSSDVFEGQTTRHIRRVDGCKPESVAAKLAILLSGIPHPLHEALLVDPLDGPSAYARVKERPVWQTFGSTYPANVASIDVVHLEQAKILDMT